MDIGKIPVTSNTDLVLRMAGKLFGHLLLPSAVDYEDEQRTGSIVPWKASGFGRFVNFRMKYFIFPGPGRKEQDTIFYRYLR